PLHVYHRLLTSPEYGGGGSAWRRGRLFALLLAASLLRLLFGVGRWGFGFLRTLRSALLRGRLGFAGRLVGRCRLLRCAPFLRRLLRRRGCRGFRLGALRCGLLRLLRRCLGSRFGSRLGALRS